MSDTLPRLITDVQSFEIRCSIGQFVMDGPDPGRTPDLAAMGGTVTIAPDLKKPLRVRGDTTLGDRVVGVNALVFTLDPETGQLVHPDGTVGVELIDPDDDRLDPRGWTYTATVAPTEGNRWAVTFGSPGDGDRVVNIGALAGVEISPGQGANVVQQVVTARDESTAAALTASTAAIEASTAAVDATEAATYAAEVAYGQPLEATDTIFAGLVATGAATTAALDRTYRAHVSVREYGALGDGTTDDTTAVQAALNAGAGGSVYFPPGTYSLTGPLTVPDGTIVAGAGSGVSTLDWSRMADFKAVSLLAWQKGTLGPASPLTVDPVMGDPTVTVSPGHGFVRGDLVRIRSDQEIGSGEATKAEFQRVMSVAGDVLTLGGPVFDSYTAASNAIVERADLVTGGLTGLSVRGKGINPAGYGDTIVEFSLARDVTITDVKFRDVENKCLLMNSVVGLSISDAFFWFDPSFTPLQYGVALTGACQMVSLRGLSSWNDRHMITTSSSPTLLPERSEYRGIPRIVSINGCTAYGSWQAPIDTHQGGEYISITGNSLTSEAVGIKTRAKNVLISGNTIIGKRTSLGGGPNGIYVGMVAEGITITGNMIRGFRDGVRIDTPNGQTKALNIVGNTILDCEKCVYVGSTSPIDQVRIVSNHLRALPGSNNYPVYLVTTINDIEVSGNALEGGNMGVYVASPTLPVTRAVINGNTVRGQASFGMFLRNMSDALVTGNHVLTNVIRFANACPRVTTGLNMATISDLSTPGVTQK